MRSRPIAIVGAGPAGTLAAWHLATRGARVLIFDASHPREKPCGGGLTQRALRLVAPAVEVDRLPRVCVDGARFACGSFGVGPRAAFPVGHPGDDAPLVVVSRRELDAALLRAACQAGAVHLAERVRDVEVSNGQVTVRTATASHQAAFVIGADGATSLVRRRLLAPFRRDQLSVTVGVFAAGGTSTDVLIHMVDDPPGYIWSFPRPDHLALGICAQADRATPTGLRGLLDGWMAANPNLASGLRVQPYGWPIPSLAYPDFGEEIPSGPRWMLAGDAAGLVDPLTREGIYFALESGRLAAAALLGTGDPSTTYAEAIRRGLHPELARAAALKARFFTSGFSDLLVAALARSQAVRSVMVDLISGRQPYRTLAGRLVGTFEVRLAWQLAKLQLGARD